MKYDTKRIKGNHFQYLCNMNKEFLFTGIRFCTNDDNPFHLFSDTVCQSHVYTVTEHQFYMYSNTGYLSYANTNGENLF